MKYLYLMLICLLFLIITACIFSCGNDRNRARKHGYKYEDGYHIGNWVEFDGKVFELSHVFISTEKYTSILIQKYTKLICFTTPSKSFLGYPKKDFEGVVIFA